MPHPLDRPVWTVLTGRQTHMAIVHGAARRIDPEVGVFAATADWSDDSIADLAELVRRHGPVGVVEPGELPELPGLTATPMGLCCQMVAEDHAPFVAPDFDYAPLSEADAPEMLALATLTKPGPFFRRTHTFGDFVGVRQDGRLVAMAGERMRPEGMTEVSGVCTHPDHRGHGYAAGLMHVVVNGIRARGEVPLLHVYAGNTGAIRLYETLGYRTRVELMFTSISAP